VTQRMHRRGMIRVDCAKVQPNESILRFRIYID
jgi:hypothetical protein